MTKAKRTVLIQGFLFVLTFVTTTLSGTEWAHSKSIIYSENYSWNDFLSGMQFSVPFLLILTVHEFGHYFTAMAHKIKSSLPYFIPFPPISLSIGTLGAVIRIRDRVYSNIQHFDIGLAGPLAGFVVAVVILFYGFKTLPPPEYIYQFHPEYESYGLNYKDHVYTEAYGLEQKQQFDQVFGTNLLFMLFEKFVADPERVPDPHELMHYPILMAGFIALFITSLNLLPIGQLDGGHVIYGLFGQEGHRTIAVAFFVGLLIYSGLGYANFRDNSDDLPWIIPTGVFFYFICLQGLKLPFRDTFMYAVTIVAFLLLVAWLFPDLKGFSGWLVFGLLVGRLLGIYHPPSEVELPLNPGRVILGWICLLIFLLSFSPVPLSITEVGK
ncbi:MAG TPA: site-2 protease family protein [Cyclobacteriaceae bacterium]